MLLKQAIDDYLTALRERNVSLSHIRKSDWSLNKFLSPFYDRDLRDLTPGDLIGRFRELSEDYSQASLAGHKTTTRAFIRFWIERRVLETDITKKLPSYSFKSQVSKMIDQSLFDKLRNSIAGYLSANQNSQIAVRDALFVSLSMDSAARAGGMVKIKKTDALRAIATPTDCNGVKIYTLQSAGGKTGPAVILFTEPTAQLMKLWAGYSPSKEWLFSSTTTGKRLTADAVARAFERVCDFAGVPRFRSHAVRHTNITTMLLDKIDPETVRAYAGHTDIKTTLGYYRDAEFIGSRNAAAALASSRTRLVFFGAD